jgi:D-glycero-alpha-D-manno-heptose-7-phosphate kinase
MCFAVWTFHFLILYHFSFRFSLNAARALSNEFELQSKLMPQVLPDGDKVLVKTANEGGCGAKIAGHGGGGCIWAIGTKDSIRETKH